LILWLKPSCIVTKEDSERSGPPQANVSCSGLDLSYSSFILTKIITLFSLRLKYCFFKIATCARLDTKQSFDVNQKSRIIAQVPPAHAQRVYETVHTLGMMFRMYRILYAISVHYKHCSGQSKNMFVPCSLQKSEKKSHIFDILIYRMDSPHQSACLLIRVLSLEARRATQAERLTATTATAAASVVAAVAAEQASSASPPFFALAPPVEMDYIASQPTPASADWTVPCFCL